MIVIETIDHNWFCTNSIAIAKKIKDCEILNLWSQPFNYPCDFFWEKKDGTILKNCIPMRNWELDLPLSKCLKGGVKFLSKEEKTKPPKWYRDFLSTDWETKRKNHVMRCKKYAKKYEEANGDEQKQMNVIIDFFLDK
jgi:hypothetical protein